MDNSPNYIPMEWEIECYINNEKIKKIADKIYNTVVPKDCFRLNYTTTCINENERIRYFIKNNSNEIIFNENMKNLILNSFAIDWIKKPYCYICFKQYEENQYIIEHEHDLNKRGMNNKNLYAGVYRGKVCKRCNILEGHAKLKNINLNYSNCNIPNKNQRLKYWCIKNNFLNEKHFDYCTPKSEFIFTNLQFLGYMN